MRIKFNLLAALIAFGSISAQTADIGNIYEAAVENDPILGAAVAGYRAQKQIVPQARAGLLPSASIGGSSTWTERSFPVGPQLDPGTGLLFEIPDDEFNEHAWRAQVRQPIFNLESWFNYSSAKASREGAKHNLSAAKLALIVRVSEAYLNVLRAQDLLESTQASEAAVKRQLDQVQQRFDVGLVAITDVLEAQAAYDNALVNLIQADGDQGIFFQNLTTLTNESYDSLDRLSDQLPIINPDPTNEETWVSTALSNNLQVLAATEQLLSARRTLKARRSVFLPKIDATASHSHFVTGGQSFLGGKIDDNVYGLEISMPIFQGGFNYSRSKEARALVDQAQEQLRGQQLTVSRDARNLYRAVATDVIRVKARNRAIKSSESALDATETGYEVGTRNIVDVLQAQQRLFSSQFDYADSRYKYVLDLLRLKQTVGTLTGDDLIELNNYMDSNNPVEIITSLRNYGGNLSGQ